MFDKREYRMFSGMTARKFAPPVQEFWAKEGFRVVWLSPWHMRGESLNSRIGLRRNFSLTLHEQEGTTYMDLQIEAKVTDAGLVCGAAGAFICLPLTAVAGVISYSEYEKDAMQINGRFWDYMGLVSRACAVNN